MHDCYGLCFLTMQWCRSAKPCKQRTSLERTNLADVSHYLIVLAKTLKAVAADSTLDHDFLAHAFTIYNSCWEQMGTPLIRLALFLYSGYRVVGTQADEFKILCKLGV